jgi:hypothetical protein
MESNAKESSWFWFIFTVVFLGGLWYGISATIDISEISRNWSKYRCSPGVMPFASMYGYDTSQNFNYCMKAIFEGQVSGVTGPFSTILGTMMKSLMTFLENINSMRIMIATLVGGIVKTLQEFSDRFKLLFSQIKLTFLKIQQLMKRLFGTFHSVIYMGLSAVQVGSNFSETFIFKFLDTFCFSPETLIMVKGKGKIEIKNVLLGDILENNEKVLSVYRFLANGQKMVLLNGVEVSTNHFVKYNNIFIEAKDHPNAIPIPSWSGGSLRPLICLDTDEHTIPINNTIFSDWDETNEIDSKLMIQNENLLNNTVLNNSPIDKYKWIFQPALSPDIKILYKNGTLISCKDVNLGDELSTGRVVGIGKRLVYESSELPSGLIVTPSTLFWNKNKWERVGKTSEVIHSATPSIFYSFVVLGTASIELSSKEIVRDMCEIHSPDNDNLVRAWFRPESLL